jgi:hypothetical protein
MIDAANNNIIAKWNKRFFIMGSNDKDTPIVGLKIMN